MDLITCWNHLVILIILFLLYHCNPKRSAEFKNTKMCVCLQNYRKQLFTNRNQITNRLPLPFFKLSTSSIRLAIKLDIPSECSSKLAPDDKLVTSGITENKAEDLAATFSISPRCSGLLRRMETSYRKKLYIISFKEKKERKKKREREKINKEKQITLTRIHDIALK